MCFTPIISLTTAILEFIVATFILIYFKRTTFVKFSVIFIYVLGFYQFTEFMLCTSGNEFLWAKMGFITYTFLPAIGLHFALTFDKKKYKLSYIYLLPILISIFAFLNQNFILTASCDSIFVIVQTMFFSFKNFNSILLFILYVSYYFGFILVVSYILIKKRYKTKNKKTKIISLIGFLSAITTLTLPLIMVIILPSFRIQFPSVYCEFAVLFTIFAVVGCYINNKG